MLTFGAFIVDFYFMEETVVRGGGGVGIFLKDNCR
jgi:hypothetical protein